MHNKRKITIMSDNWKFTLSNPLKAQSPQLDDSKWRTVCVPHDWAIEGPFDENNDLQVQSIFADGIRKPIKLKGRTGGLPISGVGWYRLAFQVSDFSKHYELEFDGIMSNSEIYLNGKKVGGNHYGYTSFSVDITPYVLFDKNNILAVKAAPEVCSSRFYPGAGIFREVRLIETNVTHIDYNGTYVKYHLSEGLAEVNLNIKICGENKNIKVKNELICPDNTKIQIKEQICSENTEIKFKIQNPLLWNIENPNLYVINTSLVNGGKIIDEYKTVFGLRKIEFDADKGFFLNNEYTKMKGVCLHHDLGPLGSAFNKSAMERELSIMKEMGCNAIRTSHNPPARELLDLCDKMGFLVLDEAFDEWKYQKVDNGYHKYFDKCAEFDLVSLIHRDRNHPCVIMWSIGNEIIDQHHADGKLTARMLTEICHREDSSRPVTAAFNNPEGAIPNGLCDEVDVVGFNYKPHRYEEFHKAHPTWKIYGSETSSCVSSRGEYTLPVKKTFPIHPTENFQISSYDIGGPQWACMPDTEFAAQEDMPYVMGEFVWTGFDYLGEPTPFRSEWPSHSSYFGIVDIAGIPKDRFYSYQAEWSNKTVLHLVPQSWNWKTGDKLDIHCYSNLDHAELFLNGKSLGVSHKNHNDEFNRFRFVWKNILWEKGELKVIGYNEKNIEIATDSIKTSGEPYSVKLIKEPYDINPNNNSLAFIRVQAVDKDGILCPLAKNDIVFSVSGEGTYKASANGDSSSLHIFSENICPLFHGQCTAYIQSNGNHGNITIHAESIGLIPSDITITVK